MTQNFSNAKIYKITNDYNDEVYIGSTCDTLIKRFSGHKSRYNKQKYINIPIYKLMNEIGIERFRIDLVEDYPCNDKMALRQREGFWIREIATLNKRIEGRTIQEYKKEYYENNVIKLKEYREQNKEKLKENRKEYYENNAIKFKEYREQNRNIIKEKGKEYYNNNKDKVREYQKEYYQKKKLEKQQLNI